MFVYIICAFVLYILPIQKFEGLQIWRTGHLKCILKGTIQTKSINLVTMCSTTHSLQSASNVACLRACVCVCLNLYRLLYIASTKWLYRDPEGSPCGVQVVFDHLQESSRAAEPRHWHDTTQHVNLSHFERQDRSFTPPSCEPVAIQFPFVCRTPGMGQICRKNPAGGAEEFFFSVSLS